MHSFLIMDALITEVYHMQEGRKRALHGKNVNKREFGETYMNVWGTRSGKYPLIIKEGDHFHKEVIDYSSPGQEEPYRVRLPDSFGYHLIHVELGRFRCQLEYTVR